MRVLVTGGAGFIGSHQVVALAENGHDVLVVDDMSNSSEAVIARLEQVIGRPTSFQQLDLRDRAGLHAVLEAWGVDAAIHFAAKKHVAESVAKPRDYYDVNLGALNSLVDVLHDCGVRRMVFSSSGSVYGSTTRLPIPEDEPHRPTNPYSTTKAWGEIILRDICAAELDWSVIALRYFNPAGAHPSGLIGEDPTGLRTNLLPVLMDVATGRLPELVVHGDDFDTADGTCVRDYVHVMDVARAHVAALERLRTSSGFEAFNIGRGEGVSVLQLAAAVEEVTGRPVPRRIGPQRPGDVAALYADTSLAARELGLSQYASLHEICNDAWTWEQSRTTHRPQSS